MLIGASSALKLNYRPPAGTVPWHSAASRPTWDTPDHPVNYYVPNFGVDHNILTTMNSLKIAERGAKKELKANFAQMEKPKDMRIVDLGKDEDVMNAALSIKESETENNKVMAIDLVQKPVQYKTAFVQDSEIGETNDSL